MSEEELRQLVRVALGENLAESVPNKSLVVPSFIIDHNYMEQGNLYTGGKCQKTEQRSQIDLYYRDKPSLVNAYEALKGVLINNGIYGDSDKGRDSANGYWRATFVVLTEG